MCGAQAISGLLSLQTLNMSGCGSVQGDALTALATLTALRQVSVCACCASASHLSAVFTASAAMHKRFLAVQKSKTGEVAALSMACMLWTLEIQFGISSLLLSHRSFLAI